LRIAAVSNCARLGPEHINTRRRRPERGDL